MKTIAAIATALAEAGISIIRISGPEAFSVADRVFAFPGHPERKLADCAGYTVHYGHIVEDGHRLDEVLAVVFRAPKSFTAEDVVEFQCHGGIYVTKRILRLVLDNGASPAEPGEFTKRAFLNGRIDLTQAEAVAALIRAENDYALSASVQQLSGATFRAVKEYREVILNETARIEAALDDPEHLSLGEEYPSALAELLTPVRDGLMALADRFDEGRVVSTGIRTVLVGRPNAGKSSVLNVLCGRERAIVTDIPGTTRDTIEERVRLGDMTLLLMDTAGIRQASDAVEQIGVERSFAAAAEADLILYICDTSLPLSEDDRTLLAKLPEKPLVVLMNKSDLTPVTAEADVRQAGADGTFVTVSAKTGEGFDELRDVIAALFAQGKIRWNEQAALTNDRQRDAVRRAAASLTAAIGSAEAGLPEDFYTIDLLDAYAALGELTGETIEDDLADRIFEKFCMGK